MLDLCPCEAREAPGETGHEALASWDFEGPIEEVRFHDSADLRLGKERAAQQGSGRDCLVGDVDADDGVPHDLGHGDEKRVTDEQRLLVAEAGAESRTEQLRP